MIRTIAATALSAVMAITAVVPAQAFPMTAIGGQPAQVEKVQAVCLYGNMCRDRPDYRHYRDTTRDNYRYWHGHRGYHDYRPGYRRGNDGWWYPLAAFGLGAAIIGGMAAQQRAPRPQLGYAMPPDHVRWCQSRYRSYDPYSDTFQPYRGPRQRCVSPY
ncbi:MAG: lectin [Proteobacteria bacterium]|nr:lectin [Pseudomonadota bacterium]